MIGTALILQGAELLGWTGLYFRVKRETTKRVLIHGSRPQSTKIPIVDSQLQKLAGHPSKLSRAMAGRVIGLTRRIVKTRAFEHLVVGLFNRKSKLHSIIRKKSHSVRVL